MGCHEAEIVKIDDNLDYALEVLENLKAAVESGELRALAFAAVMDDGDVMSGSFGAKRNSMEPFKLLGALQVLQFRMLSTNIGY